ncbi:cell wall hydrolase [Oceanobacillus oncorhynchi]|uniref:cell wall hydrolase n=1 Tax=Oceanobacillus oncorhynchi TaxID=545501 RepID=UPI0025A38E1C|nr:cell wall hydrolase [Oceanobacillus oncorhynchi]MDM8098878.1 cell wall hydrolase [Oceanobacillus oncorhynchi]
MAIIAHNEADVDLLARLMRAEAEGDGDLGMLMAGNTGANRVLADCLDFTDIRTISTRLFQSPGGFEATQKGYFYQRTRESEKRLTRRALQGKMQHPASNSLWFFMPKEPCPDQWYGQWNTGRFKSHCFYAPSAEECPTVFR